MSWSATESTSGLTLITEMPSRNRKSAFRRVRIAAAHLVNYQLRRDEIVVRSLLNHPTLCLVLKHSGRGIRARTSGGVAHNRRFDVNNVHRDILLQSNDTVHLLRRVTL